MKQIAFLLAMAFLFTSLVHGQTNEKIQALFNEGQKLYNHSDFYGAAKKWEEGLEIAKKENSTRAISAFIGDLGLVYWNLGDYQNAISYYQEALKIDKEIGDKKGIGADLTNLGIVYRDLGDNQKAVSYLEEALTIEKEIGDKKGIGTGLTSLGVVYLYQKDNQKAISYFEEALKMRREIGDRQGIAGDLSNLGLVYWNLGDYQKPISYYEQALVIFRELGAKKEIGSNLTGFGDVYWNLGDYQKAISSYDEALNIFREIGYKKGAAADLNNLGLVYSDLGDYQKAISSLEEALEIDKELGAPTIVEEANIADIHLETGEMNKAEEEYLRINQAIRLGRLSIIKKNYDKAIEWFSENLKDDIQSRRAISLFCEYCGLGEGFFGIKEYQKAKENFEQAITLTEEQRESLGESEKAKFFVAKNNGFYRTQPYEGMVRTLITLHQNNDAFFYSENLKARVLSEAIASKHSGGAKILPSDLAEDEEQYITKIRELRKEMETLFKNKQMDIYDEKEKNLKEIKSEQNNFVINLRKLYPEYASINYPQPIKTSEVKLNKNEALIEFEVTDEKTYVFLLRDGKIEAREAPITRRELKDLVLKYREYFEGVDKLQDLLHYKAELGREIYAVLFGNMLDAVPKGNSLIIVPDEFLGILPFEALVTALPKEEKIGEGNYGPFPLGVKYFGDKYSISYAQSATSLTLLRSLKKGVVAGETAFAVCDPIFSKNDSRMSAVVKAETDDQGIKTMGAMRDWRKMGVAGVKGKGEGNTIREEELFPRLEKTDEIGKGIKKLFGENAVILTGEEANEEKIESTELTKYKYYVFATHGILDGSVPYIKEPALVLTQVGNRKGYDGFLMMTEVMGLKMGGEVVALTGCETGVGKNVNGEGVMGMGRAFQYAGCGNVLMSLWSVAEDATVSLSNAFFRNLKEGKTPKDALRLARIEIRRNGYEHPFYWSGFILVGN